MSSRKARNPPVGARAFCAALAFAALLAGCGLKPLYGRDSAAKAPATVDKFAAIEIAPIADRNGQIMRNDLIDRMHPQGPAGDYHYKLTVAIREYDQTLGLQLNATSTRGQLKFVVNYALSDASTGAILIHEQLRTSAAYNILVNQFGTVLGADDARERGLGDLSDSITEHLALFLNKQNS